ncbi:hypothetical protein HanXRQr2_Chr15g0677141 [Helianthus annuus]|uniref:Uncharacterized protein n=1 Tax=Helianthus annuus TaxID=4232 RepID=A0A251S634_HELAN|nr:uncharacterized protein LOC110910508 [Helianthus annuus]KAF5763165.1 hypothetical protein HanXRQr2_Chr15g0677141 [Helianthus annuus]KAJ0454034.1 hypothetical protein HanIR_Chr15g0735721 [Helianthus annuus]KAJ0471860.1 hypothetical protein HanHA89_Chr15g0600711 [Helianthus annuus]
MMKSQQQQRSNNNKASSTTSKRKRKMKSSQGTTLLLKEEVLKLSCEEFKMMPQLCSIDDAFHLSHSEFSEIFYLFVSGRLAATEEYMKWNLYAKAFYLKLHSSCGNIPPFRYESLQVADGWISSDEEEPPLSPDGISSVDELTRVIGFARPRLLGPFKFGEYTERTQPRCIPYHLYLLLKQAVAIIKSSPTKTTKLKMVEKKIRFFCNYFHSHLPPGWKYKRDRASKEVESYDPTRKPRYDMSGYTPISSFTGAHVEFEYDEQTRLSRQSMIATMWIIHSRQTPILWELSPEQLSFYCKICSCFGIDYHRLEAASEDDVRLMFVGVSK